MVTEFLGAPLDFACLSPLTLAPALCFPVPTNLNPGLVRRNLETGWEREQWATGSLLTLLGLWGLHPDLSSWGLVTWEAQGLGFLVMMSSYQTSPQHRCLSINFPETTGADKTEPHTSNVRSRQGLGRQGKDLGISLPGGDGLEVCAK